MSIAQQPQPEGSSVSLVKQSCSQNPPVPSKYLSMAPHLTSAELADLRKWASEGSTPKEIFKAAQAEPTPKPHETFVLDCSAQTAAW